MFPDDTQRISIVGRTGSGKTVAAAFHLSRADFDTKPWVVYDFKGDKLLAQIGELEGTEHIDLSYVPKKPGIYFVHPHPDDVALVSNQLERIWEREYIGVYVDEGLMIGRNNRGFRAILTQGRSKHIPMIILSQRPAWLDRFVFSESDFFQVFDLNHIDDRKKMMEYVPADLTGTLPEYWSYYHQVAKKKTFTFRPSPGPDDLVLSIDTRLAAMRRRGRKIAI